MADRKKQSFVTGAAVLTASTVIIKILGAVFKIPLSNIIGKAAMGDFGVAYNIYALLLTLSTAGLPVALSRMVSEADALGRRNQVKRTFRVARAAFFVLGTCSTLFMLVFSRYLADFMGSVAAEASISVLAPALLFVCLMSAYRGYTQGLGNMVPTSISQIIETLCKVVFGLSAAWILIRRGRSGSVGAAGGIFGVTVGTVLGLVYIVLATLRLDRRDNRPSGEPDVPESRSATLKKLIFIGVPIIIGSCVLNLVALVDTKMIYGRLQTALGYSYETARSLYGTYFNSQTLYNLPSSFAVPMVTSAIPAIAAYAAERKTKDAAQVLGASLKLMNLLAMPMAVGMGVLAAPLMGGLYGDTDPAAGAILSVLSAAGYGVCIMMVTNAILQAYGHERLPILTIAVGGVCKIAVNYVLLGNPGINIVGAAVGNVACYLVISLLNLLIIRRKAPDCPRLLPLFLRPLLASLLMGGCAWGAFVLLRSLFGSMGVLQSGRLFFLAPAVLAVGVGVVTYLVFIVVLKAITKEELELVPKGDKLAKLLRVR